MTGRRTTRRAGLLAALVGALLVLGLAAPGPATAAGSAIADKYAATGGVAGPLSFPLTGEWSTPDGVGRFTYYLGGYAIYATPATGAQLQRGAILFTWATMGFEQSPLGYPVADEHDVPGGRASDYQHGSLVFSYATGRVSMRAPDGAEVSALPVPYRGTSNQVVTVAAAPGSSDATVQAWRRDGPGWASVVGPVAAKVGPSGIGQASEDSANTPAGVYGLSQAFGRQANPGTALPYFRTGPRDWWDENPASSTYNLHVVRDTSPGGNSENLYTAGPVYDYAVVLDYNTARVPGAGSAFFLHVTDGRPTAGCVAIPAAQLTAIMAYLDPAQQPVIDIATV